MKLIAGWGFRAEANASSFVSCWQQAGERLFTPSNTWIFAALDSRIATPAGGHWLEWQNRECGSAVRMLISEADIRNVTTPTQSDRLMQRFGTGSLCEALALRAAQVEAEADERIQLIVQRIVSADRQATLAVVQLAPSTHTTNTGVFS